MVTTTYTNFVGKGARRWLIDITTTANITNGPISNMVDGIAATGNNNGNFCNTNIPGVEWKFHFPFPLCIDEFKWIQDAAGSQGTYDFMGSNDDSTYVTLASGINLGGSGPNDVHAFSNVDYYLYYKLLSTAGNTNNSRWIEEIEFKCALLPTDGQGVAAGPTLYTNLYGSGARYATMDCRINHQTACGESDIGSMPGMVDGVDNTPGCGVGGGAAWSNWTDAVILFSFRIPVVIDEFTWSQQNTNSHGTWTLAGSLDNVTFVDLQSGINLGGIAASHAYPVANVSAYRFYKLYQTAGSTTSSPWLYEVMFKTSELAPLAEQAPGSVIFIMQ